MTAMRTCPEKKNCKPLAALPLIEGFMCVGRMAKPTDHVTPKVNDLQLCCVLNQERHWWQRWHINEDDIVAFMGLLVRALEADDKEREDALRNEGPAKQG